MYKLYIKLRQRKAEDCYACGDEPSGSINCWKFLG